MTEYMGVDHGRGNMGISEQFLHCAYIIVRFQQVSCKTMAERVAAHPFVDATGSRCPFDCFLQPAFMQMMTANFSAV